MATTPALIPRLFRNIGIAKTNSAGIVKTEIGNIIDFRSIRGDGNITIKEYTDYISVKVNSDSFLSFTKTTSIKTSTYTAVVGDTVVADISNGSFTINLPDATVSTNKDGEIIIKIYGYAAANILTISCYGSQTIDGSTTRTLTTDYATMWLKCDGSNWLRLT